MGWQMVNDGGPAFPTEPVIIRNGEIVERGSSGMTLRQWYAGMVVQGLLAGRKVAIGTLTSYGAKAIAEQAWLVADAMLTGDKQEP